MEYNDDQTVVTVRQAGGKETTLTNADLKRTAATAKKAARTRHKNAAMQDTMTATALEETPLPQPALKQIFNEQILKVKVIGGEENFREVVIVYQIVNERHDPVTCELKLGEKPHPDLFTALNALLALSVTYGGLDEEVWCDGWVSGVSIKPTGANEFGINVTAQCQIEGLDSPALSNTPYLTHDLLSLQEQALLRSVIEQARLFIYGKRAHNQLELGI